MKDWFNSSYNIIQAKKKKQTNKKQNKTKTKKQKKTKQKNKQKQKQHKKTHRNPEYIVDKPASKGCRPDASSVSASGMTCVCRYSGEILSFYCACICVFYAAPDLKNADLLPVSAFLCLDIAVRSVSWSSSCPRDMWKPV